MGNARLLHDHSTRQRHRLYPLNGSNEKLLRLQMLPRMRSPQRDFTGRKSRLGTNLPPSSQTRNIRRRANSILQTPSPCNLALREIIRRGRFRGHHQLLATYSPLLQHGKRTFILFRLDHRILLLGREWEVHVQRPQLRR